MLDTHAWLWWVAQPDRLSFVARAALSDAARIGVSTASVAELIRLVRRGRISLDRPPEQWVHDALCQPRVRELPPSAEVALAAERLAADGFPGDAHDRVIYATAQTAEASLVTRDERIRDFDPDRTLW